MQGMQDILGMLGGLGGGELGGLASLTSLLGGLGEMGSNGGANPLTVLSALGNLANCAPDQTDSGGLDDILNACTGEEESPEAAPAADPCRHCRIRCDRAGLDLPPYETVRQMAAGWYRY